MPTRKEYTFVVVDGDTFCIDNDGNFLFSICVEIALPEVVTIRKVLNKFYPCVKCRHYPNCRFLQIYFPIRRKDRKHLENVKHRSSRSGGEVLGECEDFSNKS